MPHKNKPRYITPLEVQSILDGCYGCDCHLAMMQCIAKGINDLLRGRPSGLTPAPIKTVPVKKPLELDECQT